MFVISPVPVCCIEPNDTLLWCREVDYNILYWPMQCNVCMYSTLVLMTSLLNESPTQFDSIIENVLPWVMGHMGHGSYGSWVKYSVGHMGHGSLEVTHRLPCLRHDSLLRITLEGQIQGKKAYGRPRTMLLD